jgi:CHAT domain-containing protein
MQKQRLIKLYKSLVIILALSTQLAGCATVVAPRRVYLESTARYDELVKQQEEHIAKSKRQSAADLYNLCYAYSKVKDYTNLFDCADKLEKQIKAGDTKISLYTSLFKSDGSPTPYLLRAEAYIELSQYHEAITQAIEGYRLSERVTSTLMGIENSQHTIHSLGLIALAYTYAGDIPKAREYLKTLEDLSLPYTGSAQTQPLKNHAIARVYMALRDFSKAHKILNRSDGGWARMVANVLIGGGEDLFATVELPNAYMKAKCLLETGDISQAKEEYDSLLNNVHSKDVGEIYWMLLFDRGLIAEKEGNLKESVGYYRQAVDVIEQKRSTINTEASKIGFVGDKQAVYRYLIAALFNDKQYSSTLEYIERSKSRALVDMLATKKDFAVQGGNEKQVRELLAMTDKSEQEGLIQDVSSKNDNTRSIIVKTKEQLQQQEPELASLVSVTSMSVAEIQKLLPSDETLVEYYYTDKDLYAFVLTSRDLSAIRLEKGRLTEEIKTFRKALENASSVSYEMLSRQLFNKLMKPVESSLHTRNLIIVPHGALHYIPFYALHDDRDYIIKRYSIRMLPSASVITYLQRQKVIKIGDILAFGNPDLGDPKYDLSYAQDEAIAVSKTRSHSKVFLRKEATETALKKFGAGFNYIHFATHGEFNEDKPLKSALLLAMDAENDGKLTVDKLYSMKLDADLITLSACETGLGKIANGDDIVGLTRGFLYAGASSIVASLWKVDDLATSALMIDFYDALEKTNKREALRKAQLQNKKKYPHPYYWAAFQLTGNAK